MSREKLDVAEVNKFRQSFGDHFVHIPTELVKEGLLLSGVTTWNGGLNNGIPNILDGDGLHFNYYGYKAIGKIIAKKLKNLTPHNLTSKMGNKNLFIKDYNDTHGHVVMKLREPYSSNGKEYIDTGFKPYDVEKNWTICLKLSEDSGGPEYPHVFVECRKFFSEASSTTAFMIRRWNDVRTRYNIDIGFGGFSTDDVAKMNSRDGYHYIIITKNGSSYNAYCDSGIYYENLGYDIAGRFHDQSLHMFARREPDNNNMYNYTQTAIGYLAIYDSALSNADCLAILEEMKNS